jgi:hypothetical protein
LRADGECIGAYWLCDRKVTYVGIEALFGYRPIKSAQDAVGVARQRCWKYDWVLDLDIKGFFDNIPHDLMMRAVRKHAAEKWVALYIERWLSPLALPTSFLAYLRELRVCSTLRSLARLLY